MATANCLPITKRNQNYGISLSIQLIRIIGGTVEKHEMIHLTSIFGGTSTY